MPIGAALGVRLAPERSLALRRVEDAAPVARPARSGVSLLAQISGAGRLECPGLAFVVLAARAALVRDAARPARCALRGEGARAVEGLFHLGFARGVARAEPGALKAPLRAGASRVLDDAVLASLAALMARLGGDAATLALVARALAARLLGRHVLAGRGRSADARLRAVLAHVEAQLETELRLGALAEIAGVSVFHFARRFRREMGMPVKAYVRARRVARAVRLIEQGALPLAEIAFACGFAHQSHLTAVFRRQTGHTPGTLRAAARGGAGPAGALSRGWRAGPRGTRKGRWLSRRSARSARGPHPRAREPQAPAIPPPAPPVEQGP